MSYSVQVKQSTSEDTRQGRHATDPTQREENPLQENDPTLTVQLLLGTLRNKKQKEGERRKSTHSPRGCARLCSSPIPTARTPRPAKDAVGEPTAGLARPLVQLGSKGARCLHSNILKPGSSLSPNIALLLQGAFGWHSRGQPN